MFLLSLLTLVGAWQWDIRQSSLDKRRFVAEWADEAAGLAQRFRVNYSVEAQMRDCFRRISEKLARRPQPLGNNGVLVRQAFDECLPEGWFASSMLYVFDFSATEGKCLTGEGLAKQNGSFIARIFASLNRWDSIGSSEQKKLSARLEKLFGERTTGELLLDTRAGKCIDVVFQGETRTMFWDFIHIDGRRPGAFIFISSRKPSGREAADMTLNQIAASSLFKSVPMLVPLETLQEDLKPVIARTGQGSRPANILLAQLKRESTYAAIASFSIAAGLDDIILYRTSFSRKLPYELWLAAEKPVGGSFSGLIGAAGLLAVVWGLVLFLRIRMGRPFILTVRARLLGLILVVGGAPVFLLLPAGVAVIQNDQHARYRALIDNMRSEIREIDGNSTSLRTTFENTSRRMMSDPAFKKALQAQMPEAEPAVRKCFAEFAAAGTALNGIGIMQFGKADRMIFAENYTGRRDQSRLNFFSPMIYGGLKQFSAKDYQLAMDSFSESQKLGFETYQMISSSGVAEGIVFARQKSFSMEMGININYAFYDYISSGDRVCMAVIFFADSSEACSGFVRRAISRAAAWNGKRFWGAAERRDTGAGLVGPVSQRGPDRHWFFRNLKRSHDTGAFLVDRNGNDLQVCLPCEFMPGFVIGSTMSLEPLQILTRRHYRMLGVGALVLFLLLSLVAMGITSFFLTPLRVIEAGIERILDRQFGLRLNLDRDDELGDVADAFDNMAMGLNERYELAQFVSGSLTSRLDDVSNVQKAPEKKWGVVLATDIRSFTTMSETYPPEAIVKMLNRHLELMSGEITAQGGEIDKFIGDAIIAAFFAEKRETACENAVNAARGMIRQHRKFIAERIEAGDFAYGMGVGLSAGELLVGSFGSGDRHEYTLTGHARHQAEQLEAESKKGRFTHIVVSAAVRELVPEVDCSAVTGSDGYEVTGV